MSGMGEVMRAVFGGLLLTLAVWPSTGLATSVAPPPPLRCGPVPTVLENPPEMARVDGPPYRRSTSKSVRMATGFALSTGKA
jgi:hypothetical protein